MDRPSLRFFVDGNRLNAEDTVKMAELEDGDSIDVMTRMEGGYETHNF